MAKLTLNDLSNLQSETTAVSTINGNNTAIEQALENTLSRDGTSPNSMGADIDLDGYTLLNIDSLDMNNTKITGLADPTDASDAVPLSFIGDAPQFAQTAEDARDAALAAQAATELIETNVETIETNVENLAADTAAAAAIATSIVAIRRTYDTTTSMADPGTGKVRFNNATLASVTAIAMSALSDITGNPNERTFLQTWDDSTTTAHRGIVVLRKVGAPQNYAVYDITGATTDNTTWLQFTVTHVNSSGSISNADELSFDWDRTGDKGLDGTLTGPGSSTDNAIVRWDGAGGATTQNSTVTVSDTGVVAGASFENTGLLVQDTDASHTLNIKPGSNLTANRTYTLTTGDANRTLDISASDVTISSFGASVIDDTSAANARTTLGAAASGANSDITSLQSSTTVTTQTALDDSTKIASTNYVDRADRIMTQHSTGTGITLALSDAGKHIWCTGASGFTITIPANASVAFPVGSVITIINEGGGNVTLAITTDTLKWCPTLGTGSRTLANGALCTLIKANSTLWYVSGVGLT